MLFSLPSIKCSGTARSFRLVPSTVSLSQQFDYHALGISRKLGAATDNLTILEGRTEAYIFSKFSAPTIAFLAI